MHAFRKFLPIILIPLSCSLMPSVYGAEKRTISFSSGDETVSARWIVPEGAGPFPAVILIHEWWGLNEWIERKGEQLAQNGFAVLAVDLFRGKTANTPEEAYELMRNLPEDRALRDLSAAMNDLLQRPEARAKKIGVVGWSMGGSYAIKLAMTRSDLSACAIYYAPLPTDKNTLTDITCPVIGFFGAEDRGIPIAAIHQFEQTMQGLEKKITIRIYERVSHGFMNNTRPSFSKPPSDDSWKRCVTFLSNNLKS